MKTKTFFLIFLSLQIFSTVMADEETKDFLQSLDDGEELIAAVEPRSNNVSDAVLGPKEDDFIDPKVLRDFVESRSLIECRQKEGKLTLAADVRARWICIGEEADMIHEDPLTGAITIIPGVNQRGFKSFTNKPTNEFKSEFNLFLDYVAPKSWVSTKVRWAVLDGVDAGFPTKVDLDRAFIGYDIYECKCEDFYIEIGRSKLDYMFESRVEFSSFFDGIHLYYTNEWPNVGVYTAHGGPFVIDGYTNHFGWVVETGVKKIGCTGFSVKYSFIDWRRRAPTAYGGNFDVDKEKDAADIAIFMPDETGFIQNNPRYRFLVSQLIFGYEQAVDLPGCKTIYLYGAALTNSAAKKVFSTNFKYENKAWYAGFTFGKLCKACDWSLDVNYQYVQAQALPEFDLSGIGHGNAAGFLFSDAVLVDEFPFASKGFANYQGLEMQLLYALTDSLSLRAKAAYSEPVNKEIGSDFFYKLFEMAVIYAF